MATPTFDPVIQRALELQAQARAQQQAAEQAELQRQQAEQARLAAEAERNRSRTVGEFAGDLGAGLLQTSMNLGGAAYGLANMATLGGLDRVAGLSENFQQANQIVEGWKSAPLQARQQDVQAAFDRGALDGAGELLATPSVLGDYAVQSLGYLLPGAAAARAGAAVGATRALAAGPVQPGVVSAAAQQAATRAGLATQAGQTAGYLNVDAINAARAAGRGEGEAQAYGLAGGAIGAVVGPALSRLTGAAGLEARAAQLGMGTAAPAAGRRLAGNAATLGAFTGTQAVEEGAQETYENMVRNWAAGNELTQGNAQAAVTGGILGGVFGAALGATQVVRQPSPARTQTEQAKAEIVDTLASDTGENPLRPSLLDSLALPAPAPALALPAPNTLYASSDGSVQSTGPVINVDGTAQPAAQAQTWVNPVNTPQPSFGAGMEQQVAPGQRREIPLDSPLVAGMPLDQVAERFGQAGFIAEAARRQNATAAPAPSAAPQTDTARIAARNDFIKRAKLSSSAASTAGAKTILDDVAALDLRPGTPEFNTAVGVRVRALVANAEASGKKDAGTALAKLLDAYPVDDATYAEFRTSAAFDGDRRYVPMPETSEEAIFGPEPAVEGLDATKAEQVKSLLASTSWDERGGKLLRDDAGQAVGRTQWLSSQPEVQAVLTEYRSTSPEKAIELVERAVSGQGRPLTENQQNLVGDLVAVLNDMADGRQAKQAVADLAEASALADPTLQETLSEQAVPANDLANLVAALDAAETNEQLQQAFAAMQTDPAYARIYAAGGVDFTSLMNHMAGRVNALTEAKFELSEKPAKYMFVGQRAHGLDLAALQRAQEAVASGADREQVRKDTGWFTGADGKWRFEISDHQADIAPMVPRHYRLSDVMRQLRGDYEFVYLDQLLEHDALFDVYPQLREIAVYAVPKSEMDGAQGLIRLRGDNMSGSELYLDETLGASQTNKEALSVILHEVQHAVQELEGFAGGGDNSAGGYDAYRRLAGEVEARNVQSRFLYSDYERELYSPDSTTDVPREEVIVTWNGKRVAYAIPLQRSGVARPISTALFAKGVITANNNLGGNVQGFDTTADLAAAVGFPIPANVKGMYHNGNIYVVRENIASAKDLAYTLAHEVGHGGLDKLLGDSLTAATNRMWANPAMRQRIKTKQAELGDSTSRAVAAEEVLADMLASGERLNKDLWAKLRAGVREFFARVFGLRGVAISNAEVDTLLGDVARVIQGAPAAQVRASMANPSLWLTNPVLAAQQDPKFAKVKVDLDQALLDAANETEGNVVPLSRITKAAGEAGVDAVKALGQALKMGKVGELWVNYMMHLDHMVAFYDKDFGGRLGTVAKLKELQQAEFTRTLAEEKTREFRPGKAEGETLAKRSINGTMEAWEAFRNANPARGQLLDFVQTEATFYKLFPTLPWNEQSSVDHATVGFTLGQRKAAYDAVRKAYLQMGSTAQGLYKQSQASYAALDAKRWQVLLDEVDRQGKVTEQLVTDKAGHQQTITRIKGILHNAMRASKAGSYSPLQRYGKFYVTVRNALGETVHFSAYETNAEASAAADTILAARKAAGETGVIANVGVEDKNTWSAVGVNAGTIEQLRRDAEAVIPPGLDDATRQIVLNTLTTGLTEAYLQALPTKSFLKHALGRKNIAGYDGDSLRGFANYAIRASRNIASIKYDGQIDSALTQISQYVKDVGDGKYLAEGEDRTNTTKLRAVAAAVRGQHLAAASHQTSAFVSAATGASFTYMMTSPSQMLMNATQTLLVTLPRMQAEYGAARTGREILKAAADYVKSRGDLLGPHSVLTAGSPADQTAHAALTRIREDGPLDQSQAHDAAGLADGSADALSPYWGKVMKWMSYFMHKSEVFNRQVTALAAARLEQSKNASAPVEALAESGKFWIRTTHFNYDKYNKPVALNTQVGTLLGQFRQYQIHMLSLMAKDIRDAELGKAVFFKDPINKEEAAIARRTLSYMLGAQLAFTGAAGTVLAPVAFAIADAFRALDDDEELVDSKTEFAAMIPTWAMHGLFGLGMDTGRISAATLLPVIGQRDYAPIGGKASETFAYYVTQNLGPSFGLAKNLLDGSQAVANGDFYQAGQKLLPKPAADFIKGGWESQNGARDMREVMYGQPSVWSSVNQAVGIRSAERRDLEQPRGAAYQISQRAYQFKERAKLRVALAQSTGDMDLYRETLDDVQRFNTQYPEYRVKPAELVSAARSRMRTENVAAATGVVSSRLPGPTLDAYIGR